MRYWYNFRCQMQVGGVGGGNLGTGECSQVLMKSQHFESSLFPSANSGMPVWGTVPTVKLFCPILSPSAPHTTEIKNQSQRNPKQMSVDKNKACSTSSKNRFCGFGFSSLLLTVFPVGLITHQARWLAGFLWLFLVSGIFPSKEQKTSSKNSSQSTSLENLPGSRAWARPRNWRRVFQEYRPTRDICPVWR